MDTAYAPDDITYPPELKLVHEGREKLESMNYLQSKSKTAMDRLAPVLLQS